jgi:hypothetical protein
MANYAVHKVADLGDDERLVVERWLGREPGIPNAAACGGSAPRRFFARTWAPALILSAILWRYEAAAKRNAVSPE